MDNTKNFNVRAFVSTSMFVFIIILIITGIVMEIMDGISGNYESIEIIPSNLIFIMHFITAVHVLFGFSFGIFAVIHIVINWKTLKNYFSKKTTHISKEVLFAFCLTVIFIIVGLFFALLDK
jgi:hypothetical protein